MRRLQREQRRQLCLCSLAAAAGAQRFGLIDQVEHAFGKDPRTDRVLGARAVAAREAEDEARAHQVDQFVNQPRDDELAAQPCRGISAANSRAIEAGK